MSFSKGSPILHGIFLLHSNSDSKLFNNVQLVYSKVALQGTELQSISVWRMSGSTIFDCSCFDSCSTDLGTVTNSKFDEQFIIYKQRGKQQFFFLLFNQTSPLDQFIDAIRRYYYCEPNRRRNNKQTKNILTQNFF